MAVATVDRGMLALHSTLRQTSSSAGSKHFVCGKMQSVNCTLLYSYHKGSFKYGLLKEALQSVLCMALPLLSADSVWILSHILSPCSISNYHNSTFSQIIPLPHIKNYFFIHKTYVRLISQSNLTRRQIGLRLCKK